MQRLSQNAQISFDWLEPDPLTLTRLSKLSVDTIAGLGAGKAAVLLGCGKNKKGVRSSAAQLYTSPRFQMGVRLAGRLQVPLFVISAKHGLVLPDEAIDPYDLTIDQLSDTAKSVWAAQVVKTLMSKNRRVTQVLILADDDYAEPLSRLFAEKNVDALRPLQGLAQSAHLPFLKECHRYLDRGDAIRELYGIFDKLDCRSRILPLREAVRSQLPEQGVYFFFDPTEPTRFSSSQPRLVRIGTHGVSAGSKATLRDRLRTHLGTSNGFGNHRSSVFRLHVGEALIRRDNLRERFPDWGTGQNSSAEVREKERPLEKMVSEIIGNLLVGFVAVSDQSMKTSARSTIERLTIALFTENFQPVEGPTAHWLGLHSQHEIIALTGLWNLRDSGTRTDLKVTKLIGDRLTTS